jgi:bacteriocin-like protein
MENFMNPVDELTDKELDGVSGGGSIADLIDPTSSANLGGCMMTLLNDAKEQANDMRAEMNGANAQTSTKWFVGRHR